MVQHSACPNSSSLDGLYGKQLKMYQTTPQRRSLIQLDSFHWFLWQVIQKKLNLLVALWTLCWQGEPYHMPLCDHCCFDGCCVAPRGLLTRSSCCCIQLHTCRVEMKIPQPNQNETTHSTLRMGRDTSGHALSISVFFLSSQVCCFSSMLCTTQHSCMPNPNFMPQKKQGSAVLLISIDQIHYHLSVH